MASTKLEELSADLEELRGFLELAQRKKIKDILSIEVRKLETQMVQLRENLNKQSIPTATASGSKVANSSKCYLSDITNYAWDQSDRFVKLFVTLDGVGALPAENVTLAFTESALTMKVSGLNNRDYQLVINSLLENIDVEKSYHKVKTDMVAIYLLKRKTGNTWSHLTTTEKRVSEIKKAGMGVGGGDEEDTSGNPSADIMNMMKKMYQSGDDDMKRMITKAWVEAEDKKTANVDME